LNPRKAYLFLFCALTGTGGAFRISGAPFVGLWLLPTRYLIYSTFLASNLSKGTAILTPLALCKWTLSPTKPKNWASTLNEPVLSVHKLRFSGNGSEFIYMNNIKNIINYYD